MIDVIMWIMAVILGAFACYMVHSAIESYKHMKEAKHKAMIWDARIK